MSTPASEFLFTFSVNLYKQLQAEEGTNSNIVCSPFSIAAGLSMISAGARNNTLSQISHVLHLKEPDVHGKFAALFDRLRFLPPDTMMLFANRIYASFEFTPLEDFISLLKKSYLSCVKCVEFRGDPGAACCQMNAWVAEATRFMVKDCLPLSAVHKTAHAMLVDAVYFRGFWEAQFVVDATSQVEFHEDAATTKAVNMMLRRGTFEIGHCEELKVTALRIPYRGGKVSLVVLLPEKVDGLTTLVKQLTPSKLTGLLKGTMRPACLNLRLPRFRVEHAIDLRETLRGMGVADLFTERADLSAMSAPPYPLFSCAVHKCVLDVNEEGLERPPTPTEHEAVDFTLNHPFMFFVEH
ncbi:unnamed protein product, partial [Ixodes hexagonus]